MKMGDTFIATRGGLSTDSHLWIIASDPEIDEDRVLIVNLTTASRHHDKSCVFRRGDHPYIAHDSCINYGGSYIVSVATLHEKLDGGLIERCQTATSAFMQRLWKGAAKSEHLPMDQWKLLVQQELIDS
jgi:hypothetical protein